jgi:hypothetical protein
VAQLTTISLADVNYARYCTVTQMRSIVVVALHDAQPPLDAGMAHHLAEVDVGVLEQDIRVLAGMAQRTQEVAAHVRVSVAAVDEGQVDRRKVGGLAVSQRAKYSSLRWR